MSESTLSSLKMIYTPLQSNLSNMDTERTEQSVHTREVSV